MKIPLFIYISYAFLFNCLTNKIISQRRNEHDMIAKNMKGLLELLPLRGPFDFYTPEVEEALLAPLGQYV
jgi:hypothetical protein